MKNKKSILLDVLGILILEVAIIVLTLLGVYGTPFFRDYTILFDGGYRILTGLTPFIDFSLPPIPISFYLQAIFEKIAGPNLFSLALHTIVISSILSISFYFLVRKYFAPVFSAIFSIFFYYSFSGLLAYPWYNQTALFFFLLNFFLVLYKFEKKEMSSRILIISSFLVVLSFFSKLEVGILHLISLTAYFLYVNYPKMKEVWLSFFLPSVLGIGIVQAFLSFLSSQTGFVFGKNVLAAKLNYVLTSPITYEKIIYSPSTYLILFVLFLLFKERINFRESSKPENRIILLFLIFNTVLLGVIAIAGLQMQTRLLALPVSALLAYLYFKIKAGSSENIIRISKDALTIILITLLSLIVLLGVISSTSGGGEIVLATDMQLFNVLFVHEGYIREDFGCYKGALYSQEEFSGLRQIRGVIEANNRSFISFTDYGFLYCDYSVTPPKNLPLWTHERVTIGKEDFPKFLVTLIAEGPKVILEQTTLSAETRALWRRELSAAGYENKINITIKSRDIIVYQRT